MIDATTWNLNAYFARERKQGEVEDGVLTRPVVAYAADEDRDLVVALVLDNENGTLVVARHLSGFLGVAAVGTRAQAFREEIALLRKKGQAS